MLFYVPYDQTSLRVPTATHVSNITATMDRPAGGSQIPSIASGGLTILLFQNCQNLYPFTFLLRLSPLYMHLYFQDW